MNLYVFFCGGFFIYFFWIIIYLENLLKSQNETTPRPSVQSPHFDFDEDRHERTGSVKFADQAEETKEVINILNLI